MRGFFAGSELVSSKTPVSMVPRCGACGLLKQCHSPKMEPGGKGKRRILIVGEAPGRHEDDKGKPFIGASGLELGKELSKHGVELYRDCLITNALICRPPNNRDPSKLEINYCRPNLLNTIKDFNPEIIIPLGKFGIQSLLGHLWKEDDVGSGTRWVGWQIPHQDLNAWICPTFHPAFILRKIQQAKGNSTEAMAWRHHLKQACKLEGRPWDKVPNYNKQVELIRKSSEAAKAIREVIKRGGRAAFDYETNMLKPEREGAAIVSCSICWEGRWTFAFPWQGEVVDAMSEFIRSSLGKIASNMKFEDRWTRTFFGRGARNWIWDTMINAHIMDNRRHITSIKFQAFILLGVSSYDDHIKQFLKARKGYKVNQILSEIDLDQLLLYNGLDSLLEFLVMEKQQERLKYEHLR